MTEQSQETEQDRSKATPGPAKRPADSWGSLGRAELELVAWLAGGFVLGIVLKVTTVSAYIIAVVVLVAIVRLYYEGDQKPERNPRPAIGMVPSLLLGWGLGLFVRALIS
jgi:hypothetical protein